MGCGRVMRYGNVVMVLRWRSGGSDGNTLGSFWHAWMGMYITRHAILTSALWQYCVDCERVRESGMF